MDTTGFDSSYAALYYPWIEIMDPVTNRNILIPPSGHMAGVWARNDNTRGVHKAPANEVVRGATGLAVNCTKGEQDTLNPNGVNCIRADAFQEGAFCDIEQMQDRVVPAKLEFPAIQVSRV
jgi:phage tail sheath protein FI